ncbi:MAG: hypothetical protein ACLQKA_15480 [Bryobacteraceae bacterium]
MAGHGIKRAESADKGSEVHVTSIIHPEKPNTGRDRSCVGSSSALVELEHAYEAWLRNYMSQSDMTWGVYSPAGNTFAIRKLSKRIDKRGIFRHIRGLLGHYTFFPATPVLSHSRFLSDQDAVLNDWAMVGTDLYGAIQQYKMKSPIVRAVTETDEFATAAR